MISITSYPENTNCIEIANSENICIELNEFVYLNMEDIDFKSRLEKKYDMKIVNSAHGPFWDLIPATIDKDMRKFVFAKIKKSINTAYELGIHNIVFHSGWFPKCYSRKTWIDNTCSFWNEILGEISSSMNVFIENVYDEIPDYMAELLIKINKPNIGICLDIGHANANTKIDLREWIDTLNKNIGHVHIHNNYGENDEHNGLTKGNIDIPETIQYLKEKGNVRTWNLEVKNNFKESIKMIKELS